MKIQSLRITRRGVQISVGVLWLFDGALQLQHQMFTSAFATQVIAPAAEGQPHFVSGLIHFWIRVFLAHPAVCNAIIAIIQLGIGALLLWKRTARTALIASVIWGVFVWIVGEGYGGVFSGQTSLLMGAPGASLLYALLSLAALPTKDEDRSPAFWTAIVWAVTWITGAFWQLMPGQNTLSDVKVMILGNANGAPGWLASLDTHTANVINHFGTYKESMAAQHMSTMQMANMQTQQGSGEWFIFALVAVFLFVGLGVFVRRLRTAAIIVGVVLSVAFWLVGQSLGEYYSGLATDPSTAPLIILLGLGVLSVKDLDQKLRRSVDRLADKLV